MAIPRLSLAPSVAGAGKGFVILGFPMNNEPALTQRTRPLEVLGLAALWAIVMLTGCGSSPTAPSGITNRAFVTNYYGGSTAPVGAVQIVNASNDALSVSTIVSADYPTLMAVSPAREVTMVYGTGTIAVIGNAAEALAGTIQLPGQISGSPGSMLARNATTGFAAIPNENTAVSGSQQLGALLVLDLASTFSVTNTIYVPSAHSMVMNPAASKLLVFSTNGNYPTTGNTPCANGSGLTVFDISTNTATPVCGFDHAVWGVFSSDGSTAYIMNCGPECGGNVASVQPLTMASVPVTTAAVTNAAGTPVPVSTSTSSSTFPAGATMGLLNGSTLYVAGSTGAGEANGTLTVLDVSGATPVVSANYAIGSGYHTLMALGANNKLFIGATSCTNGTGCLTVFDTSAKTAATSSASGNVTGMAPIPNRGVVYVCEGPPGVGQLHVYYTAATTPSFSTGVEITGNAVDVKTIDQ